MKGHVKKPGIDVEEVFTPAVRMGIDSIIIFPLGKSEWLVYHFNMKLVFLNRVLEEEVYVSQPEGYVKWDESTKVYKLSKALYGLCHAPRAWNLRLDRFLKGLKFVRYPQQYAMYIKRVNGKTLIVRIYVDDLVVTGDYEAEVMAFKQQI